MLVHFSPVRESVLVCISDSWRGATINLITVLKTIIISISTIRVTAESVNFDTVSQTVVVRISVQRVCIVSCQFSVIINTISVGISA